MGLSAKIDIDINNNFNNIIKDGIINGLTKAINRVHAQAVQTSPILTGVLRLSHSIDIDKSKLEAEVYIPENSPASIYAPILELTTPPMTPSNSGSRIPWLRPALYDNKDECTKDINDEVHKKLV